MIKPIKNDKQHEAALKRVYELMEKAPDLLSAERDELEVLSILVEDYEKRKHPINAPDPVEVIKSRMEQMGLDNTDLASILGSRSRVSEILNKRRKLSLEMIRALNRKLHIPADALIGKY
jgi:HTH-type transcriptional regulator/antitoxin HigA